MDTTQSQSDFHENASGSDETGHDSTASPDATASPASEETAPPPRRRISTLRVLLVLLLLLVLVPILLIILFLGLIVLMIIRMITGELAWAYRWISWAWYKLINMLHDDGRRNVKVRGGGDR